MTVSESASEVMTLCK